MGCFWPYLISTALHLLIKVPPNVVTGVKREPTVNKLMGNQGRNQQWLCKDNIDLSAAAVLAEPPQRFKKGIYLFFSFLPSYTNSLLFLFNFFPLLAPHPPLPCFTIFTAIIRFTRDWFYLFFLYNNIKDSNFFSLPPFSPPPPQNLL